MRLVVPAVVLWKLRNQQQRWRRVTADSESGMTPAALLALTSTAQALTQQFRRLNCAAAPCCHWTRLLRTPRWLRVGVGVGECE